MNQKFLPIGSICTIKSSNRQVMIIGYFALDYIEKVKLYDYQGCIYPEGTLGLSHICFNHSDILTIEHMGYKNGDFELLNSKLNNQLENKIINDNVFTNFEFDENGVVIFAQPVVKEEKKEQLIQEKVISSNNVGSVNNPFHKEIDYEQSILTEAKEEEKNWPIFSNLKFDENGVVISAE